MKLTGWSGAPIIHWFEIMNEKGVWNYVANNASAIEFEAQAGSRISQADEYKERAKGAGSPTGEGAASVDCLEKRREVRHDPLSARSGFVFPE